MHVTLEQLDDFHKYAVEKLAESDGELTWSELFQRWKSESPADATADESADDTSNA